MGDTLEKLITIEREQGTDAANVYLKEITDKFALMGIDNIRTRMKSFIRLVDVPKYAKDIFLSTELYDYAQNRDGSLKELNINEYIEDPKDQYKHYYVYAHLTPVMFTLTVGEHRKDMKKCVDISDINVFFNF